MKGATLVASLLALIGLASLLVFMNLEPDNCWSNYSTEEQAILYCEGDVGVSTPSENGSV